MFLRSFKLIFLIVFWIALESHAVGTVHSAQEIPRQMRALEVLENPKISTSLGLRFAELGRLAGLSSVYETKAAGYPFRFQITATNPSLSKALLARVDLKISAEWTEKLYRIPNVYIIPMRLGSQQATVFFMGFTEDEVVATLNTYRKQYASLSDFLIPRAQASETAKPSASSPSQSPSSKKAIPDFSVSTERFLYAFQESSLKCLSGVSDAAYEVLIEPFVMAGGGLKTLANPNRSLIENFTAMAKATVRDWEVMKTFLLSFDRYAKEEVQNFISLPPAEKSKVYCNFLAGSISGSNVAGKVTSALKLTGKPALVTAGNVEHLRPQAEIKAPVESHHAKNSQMDSKPSVDRGPPVLSPAEAISKLETNLGRKVKIDISTNQHGQTDIFLYDTKGNVLVGYLEVRFHKDKKLLDIGMMDTDLAYRGKGFGDAMVGAALKQNPDAEFIKTGALILTNKDAYFDALDKGMSQIDALKQTPAYKIRAKFGFTEIIQGSVNSEFGFIVRKPKP